MINASNVSRMFERIPVIEDDIPPSQVLCLYDPDYDETTADLREPECLILEQADEYGAEHRVVLSVEQVRQLLPHLLRWKD